MSLEAVKAQRFAIRLSKLIETHIQKGYCSSMRDFSRKVGISHSVIHGYLAGLTWVDGRNLARLEVRTGESLWDTQEAGALSQVPPYYDWSN